jgi:branched-chain amino acid transport system permease protein
MRYTPRTSEAASDRGDVVTELLQYTLFGLMLGCVYAIAAMGLVLTYTVTGVFNFAHGAVGMLAAFTYFELRERHGVPTPIAIVFVVLVLAPLGGLATERLLRRFQGVDYATSLVVTVALTVGLLGIAQRLFDPGEARYAPYLFGDHRIEVLSVPITYDRMFIVVVAAAVAFGLRFLLFGTGLGAQMRAVVDDGELAQLHGVRSKVVARLSWMIGFVLAALGGVLFAGGQNLSAIVLTLLVLNAYGAAMVGRLTSLPLTCVGALALGLIQELSNLSWLPWADTDDFTRIRLAIPGIFLVAAVLLVPSFRLSAGRVVGRDEPRIPSLRSSLTTGLLVVAGVALFANLGSDDLQSHVVRGIVTATIALSLVALTGLSGQVSLAQYLFVGIGAFVTGKTFGGDSVLGMLLGGIVAAVLAGFVALPAVRLRGLHLALCTFGMALIGREVVLGHTNVFGISGLTVSRPEVLGISFESDGAFAVWCAIVFALLAVLVGVVRRSWFGRQLTSLRDSELAAATLGLPVKSTKLAIFAVSGFVAGCAGALYGGLSGAVQGTQFEPVNSLVILLFAYVGGITTVLGAALAGVVYASLVYAESTFEGLGGLVFVVIGAAAVSLGRQPNGLAGLILDRVQPLRERWADRSRTTIAQAPSGRPVVRPTEAEVPA